MGPILTTVTATDNITTKSGARKKKPMLICFHLTQWNEILAAKISSDAEPSTTWIILKGDVIMTIQNKLLATFLTELIDLWF